MPRSHGLNAFETTLTDEVEPGDTEFPVVSTGEISSPTYMVIEPDNSDRVEWVYFDGSFLPDLFVTSALANRYLEGSAEDGPDPGITHPSGSLVRYSPVQQHLDDIWDEVEDKSQDPHGNEAHDPDFSEATHDHDADYVDLAGDTMTGDLDMDGRSVTSARVGHKLVGEVSGETNIDFNDDLVTHELSGDVTYSSVNVDIGRHVTVRVVADGSTRSLTFPAEWLFLGEKPVEIAANKTGVLALETFGTLDGDIVVSDVVAAWAVEE